MMKNKKLIIGFVAFLIIIVGIVVFNNQDASKGRYMKISAKEAYQIMNNNNEVVIIDVRTQEEYDEGHIKGALCIPNETITSQINDELPNKQQEILVYCRSGNRSQQAANKLIDLGYTNVKDFGGIIDWSYEIIK